MLENVKSMIQNLPDTPFNTLFVNYVMKVQDENIEEELRYLRSRNNLTPISMCKLLTSERMVGKNGRNK